MEKEYGQLVLCSGSNLSEFYPPALAELNLSDRTVAVRPALIDRAAIAGQIKIFQNQGATRPESIE
ncbi:MAG: hypothetical protein H7Z75_14250 [Ferruginibacter sp.]|nr:hypothetical protein [Cytophagales bacterium]